MSGSDNVLKPSADLAREKTEESIKAARQNSKTKDAGKPKNAGADAAGDKCDAVKKMVSFENEIGNVSPNATNMSR